MSGSAPIERLLDQEVQWEEISISGCTFVDDLAALYATHQGTLEIGAAKQLNDGQRVFDADDVAAFFTPPLIPDGRKLTDHIHLPKLISDEFEISTSEARRLIVQGGVKIDGSAPLSFDYESEQLAGKTLTVGKHRSVKL